MTDRNYQTAIIIKQARCFQNMSQADLAKELGVSKQLVQAWEAGERPIVKVRDLISLCEVLRISADELLGLSPQDYYECRCISLANAMRESSSSLFEISNKLLEVLKNV